MHQIAVLSDIHGNRWALETVIKDIASRGIHDVFNLGDSLYGPLDPEGTARMLVKTGWITVRGNEDRMLVSPPAVFENADTLEYTIKSLGFETRGWLTSLRPTLEINGTFFLCHGTPEKDDSYLLRDVTGSTTIEKTTECLEQAINKISLPIILCGHDHTPGAITLSGGKLILNPGSVGLPAYIDDLPTPHSIENGTPHARYTLLMKTATGWKPEMITLSYDWEAAAAQAKKAGRSDWAEWLLTGRTSLTRGKES